MTLQTILGVFIIIAAITVGVSTSYKRHVTVGTFLIWIGVVIISRLQLLMGG